MWYPLTVKGLGNYRFHKKRSAQPNVERRPALLLAYRGQQALVRFHDGVAYSLPAAPLKKIGVEPQQRFRLIVVRLRGKVQEVRVEPMAAARPARPAQGMPKVVLRDGRKLTTRK